MLRKEQGTMSLKTKWLTLVIVVVMLGTQLMVSAAFAQEPTIDWMKYKGTELSLILNKHPYSESLIGLLPDFEAKTGMKVKYEILAEEEYFQKLRLELSTKSGQYDVFMTGPMLEWEYSSAGWLEPLDPYLSDATKTDQKAYNPDDLFPALMAANRWNGSVGSGMGEGHQWPSPSWSKRM
jgi:multiple sugar transport system substrate-binding protein